MEAPIREVLEAIKNDPKESIGEWGDLLNHMGLFSVNSLLSFENEEEVEKNFTARWVERWVCTDTAVGLKVIYFQDEPFAVSFQAARKSEEIFSFICDEELFNKAHQFATSLITPAPNFKAVDKSGLDEHLPLGEDGDVDNIVSSVRNSLAEKPKP
jgi:hypothetical protein